MPNDDTMFLNAKVDILSFFNPDQLRKVTPDIEHHIYKNGESVVFKGQITDGFYIIKQGQVVVSTKNGKGQPVSVKLGVGDFFGEMSVLEDTAATAGVKAGADGTEILTIPHDSFQKLIGMQALLLVNLKKKADERKGQLADKSA
ncbi:MAG: cyclic nucleotide-binding domain-containing protein [Elusimicrobiota bacterium]